MREFHFRLQSILDVRRYVEDQRRMELGAASSRCAGIRREIQARREERRRNLTVLAPGARAEDVGYRAVQAAYAARLNREISALERDLEEAEQQRARAVERYRIARRDADVLDRLRRRRAEVYRKDRNREDQKRIDEIAMSWRRHHGATIQ